MDRGPRLVFWVGREPGASIGPNESVRMSAQADPVRVAAMGVETLFAIVYDDLRRVAATMLKEERTAHTLSATALVHEAYLRLGGRHPGAWQDRAHFMATAARAMRRVLCDHARGRGRLKRGGDHRRLELGVAREADPGRGADLLALDEALDRLALESLRAARVVEMRYFGGMRGEDVATVLGVSARTAERDWRFARAWLLKELGDRGLDPGGTAGG